jgi:hypothetical protein
MPMNIDHDIENADWSKRSWDLWNADGTPVSTLAQLREAVMDPSDASLKNLLKLPVARSMPPGLRAELEAL